MNTPQFTEPNFSFVVGGSVSSRWTVAAGRQICAMCRMERKAKLSALVSNRGDRFMYCDHVEAHGGVIQARLQARLGEHRAP